jgi:hypothetical protein
MYAKYLKLQPLGVVDPPLFQNGIGLAFCRKEGRQNHMRLAIIAAGIMALFVSGCAPSGSKALINAPVPPTPQAARSYNGSASVGDFLTMTLDPNNKTITFSNVSTGETGTVSYEVLDNGTYAISDPNGNFISAYEIPNYGLFLDANRFGPNHDTNVLVTAVASTPITIADAVDQSFNYIQFRTSQGGIQIGSTGMDSQGNISVSTYWPFGAYYLGVPFQESVFPGASVQADPSGNFLKVVDGAGVSYVFGTADDFIADRPDGTMLGFRKAATKDFDPKFTGTYATSVYEKLAASSNQGTVESGSTSFDHGSLKISANGKVTISDSQKQVLVEGTLVPVSEVPELYNGGIFSLSDPCFGLFTFQVTTPTTRQDVYVAFQGHSVAFASFKTALPRDFSKPYSYFYGVAVQ